MENMHVIGDKINKHISKSPFRHDDKQFKVTVSIGALHVGQYQQWSSKQVFEQVDKLLYHAKNNGRDQTVCGNLIGSVPSTESSFKIKKYATNGSN
ncbi:MAG: diguanylate cyclase [Psychromonas sp.]|nr:diguanylate cyclase [Alteromonadales bacterium]MCP5079920.1 diguanylate cyclase [Psychromonas sp.]